jgi:microcin C transport system substrate-binding protein
LRVKNEGATLLTAPTLKEGIPMTRKIFFLRNFLSGVSALTRTLALSSFLLFLLTVIAYPKAAIAQTAGQKSEGGTFFAHLAANPASLFPITDLDGVARDVTDRLFETLLTRHWDTYEWIPELANKWEVSPDGKEFTFTLDPKARFWDGSPVTAEDVKFSFDVIFMEGVETASLKPYYEKIQGVEILAKDKVKFKTKDVYYKNFDVCAGLTIFQKKHYLKMYAKDKTLTKAESTKEPMGTSMWKIEKWDENQQIIMARDPNYWNKAEAIKNGLWNYDRYLFKIILDDSVAFETFRKGDLTFQSLSPKQWELQTKGPEFGTRITKVATRNKSAVSYSYLGWNFKNPILANKDVRWALSHLADVNKWIQKLDYGRGEPTIGPYSPKMEEHDPSLSLVPFSIKEARRRLAAAGWTKPGKDGILVKDGKRFELNVIYAVQSKEWAEPRLADFKNQAAKVGIDVKLKAVEWTSFVKLTEEKNFDGVTLVWQRNLEGDLKQIWHSSSANNNGSNMISYSNPELDALIDQHRATMDRSKRIELARKMQRIVYEDQPYTFFSERKQSLYAHQNYVQKKQDSYNYTIGQAFWQLKQSQ